MIVVRYAVCSERQGKAVTRVILESRTEAERTLEHLRQNDGTTPESSYWVAELGPECESWRWLVAASSSEPVKGGAATSAVAPTSPSASKTSATASGKGV